MSEDLIRIASQGLSAGIHPLGAQLFFLQDAGGRDLLWDGDPAVWKGRAPILFPIIGALAGNAYRLDGKAYSLSRHGFARDRMFTLLDATAQTARLRLGWDAESLALYPFRFELVITFSLSDATLRISALARNLEEARMLPASFGFHPAFRWPLPYGEPRGNHVLEFGREEPAPIRRLDSQGLLMPEKFDTPVQGRKLPLRDQLFEKDVVMFDSLASRRLRYGAAQGPQLEIRYDDMPQLGVWTKPGAGFICIEPWHGFADPQGYAGDFRDKPGLAHLPPGTGKEFTMEISLAS
jgi:galactose mutarotase-like enzyme